MLNERFSIIPQRCSGAKFDGQLSNPVSITIEVNSKGRRRISCPFAFKNPEDKRTYCLIGKEGVIIDPYNKASRIMKAMGKEDDAEYFDHATTLAIEDCELNHCMQKYPL